MLRHITGTLVYLQQNKQTYRCIHSSQVCVRMLSSTMPLMLLGPASKYPRHDSEYPQADSAYPSL